MLSVAAPLRSAFIPENAYWIQNGVPVAGGNGDGHWLNQLKSPLNAFIDRNRTMYIADYGNHRVIEWKLDSLTGRIVAGGNGQGNRNDQLSRPTDVIVDSKTDSLIICDFENKRILQLSRAKDTIPEVMISNVSCYGLTMDEEGFLYFAHYDDCSIGRLKIGDKHWRIVAGGNGKGDGLHQLNGPTHMFVTKNGSVYVSDYGNNRIVKWMKGRKEGIIVAGGQGEGNGLNQLYRPHQVIIDQLDTMYIADYGNHRIMRWVKGATQGTVIIGGRGPGEQSNQVSNPTGILFDQKGNIYAIEYSGHRVIRFRMDLNVY
ncbi:unnamed protein product [Rotaria sp. Silwood1]|nr:unnamed protein product [Rotaria sp. Silwood1]